MSDDSEKVYQMFFDDAMHLSRSSGSKEQVTASSTAYLVI